MAKINFKIICLTGLVLAGSVSASSLTEVDKAFIKAHPSLPMENNASSLGNFDPKNDSQKEAVKWVKRVMALPDGRPAGLWLWGNVGVGKTHLSVGIAKELESRGKRVLFTQDRYLSKIKDTCTSYDVFILDDINCLYGAGDGFRDIILHAFNTGKHVFITSNTDYDEILPQAFVGAADEEPRFKDRIQNMFKVLKLSGESQRTASTWMDECSSGNAKSEADSYYSYDTESEADTPDQKK